MDNRILYQGWCIEYSVMQLKMKKVWQTSHSSSHFRNNFLVEISYDGMTGRGEAGLPPKKPGCYLADISDCMGYMGELAKTLQESSFVYDEGILDLQGYFGEFRGHKGKQAFCRVLSALHHKVQPVNRPAISAVEFAVFDLWSQLLGKPLMQCVYGENALIKFKSFCSVSLSDNMVEEARDTQKLTSHIKLKFDNDFGQIQKVLSQLQSQNIGKLLVLDANGSWSPETTRRTIEYICDKNMQPRIYCLEQPFQLDPSNDWRQIAQLATSRHIKIFADESFSTLEDVDRIQGLAHGVNVKLEKTGGLIQAIKVIQAAKEKNLEIWLGIMVSSQLGCTQTFHLSPLAQFGDLDGGMLVESPFEGGFTWSSDGELVAVEGKGLCIRKRE